MRILVVEDQAPVRRLIALWLRKHGFVVLEAGDDAEALVHLRKLGRKIPLAIVDLMGTSGLDLAAEISRDYSTTRILYISGYVDSLAVAAIARRSPEALLLKPFCERDLIGHIQDLLLRRPGQIFESLGGKNRQISGA